MKTTLSLFAIICLIFLGCSKPQPTTSTNAHDALKIIQDYGIQLTYDSLFDYRIQQENRSLFDSLSSQFNYYCISRKVDQGEKVYYIENTRLVLNYLTHLGDTGANYWDLDNDSEVNTGDLLYILQGYGNKAANQPDFACYDIFETHGEGNTWLQYSCEDSTISHGWLHRSPYDEVSVYYVGYDLYTFTFDEVRQDSIVFYEYLRP